MRPADETSPSAAEARVSPRRRRARAGSSGSAGSPIRCSHQTLTPRPASRHRCGQRAASKATRATAGWLASSAAWCSRQSAWRAARAPQASRPSSSASPARLTPARRMVSDAGRPSRRASATERSASVRRQAPAGVSSSAPRARSARARAESRARIWRRSASGVASRRLRRFSQWRAPASQAARGGGGRGVSIGVLHHAAKPPAMAREIGCAGPGGGGRRRPWRGRRRSHSGRTSHS